jgi:parallel beta-helix repeat protein
MTTFTVTSLADSGVGSLRAAIMAADAAGGSSVINFAVSGTITLASDLPDITADVKIDATTAPGYTAGAAPQVELNCNGNGGLVFGAGSDTSQLLGMSVGGASGNGITLEGSSITLAGNYVGLASDGSALGNGSAGVFVASTSNDNFIGSNPDAASGVVSNVISGNVGSGIVLDGSSGNTLVDNYVGTDPTGTTAIANGGNGIWVTGGSSNNTIGGTAYTDTTTGAVNDPTGDKNTTTAVFVVPPLGNLVSGNGNDGILIDDNSQYNVLNGNFVGTTADGDSALGNAQDGVAINGADNNSLIGCTAVENPFVYYNVLSGNGGNGLHITDSNNVTVQANFFGIGADNSTVVGNALNGILVDGTSSDVQVGGVIPLGNVSAGNGQNGIEVTGDVSGFTTFNTFGGLFAFGGAAPNGNDGLLITATGGDQTVRTNVFSGNDNNGIEIGGDASGVTVDPDIVGLDTAGTAVLANGNDGVLIDGTAHDNTIGGTLQSVIPQNLFSGNDGYGLAITDQASDNTVYNSYIGVGDEGLGALGNEDGGVYVGDTATGNTFAGSLPNVVSENDGNGFTLGSSTTDTTITGNIIGYAPDGTTPRPNTGTPIVTNGSTGNAISDNTVFPCFAAGTRLSTARGPVTVDDLCEGDLVHTVAGDAQPVRWIGHRRIDCRRHAAPERVRPVLIQAHAFGKNQPSRDLLLSPDHAIFADGVLIPVKYLINDETITQIDVATVTYYHVELPDHAAILAEGLPVESYLDTGDRSGFANAEGPVTLHPSFSSERGDVNLVMDALGFAPLRVTGPELDGVKLELARQAAKRRAASSRADTRRTRI